MTIKCYNKVAMIHLKTTCDTRRKKNDGTHPIVFRISLSGQSRDLASGFSCLPNQWDKKNRSVKPKTPELKVVGVRIKDIELILLNKLRKYEQMFPNEAVVQKVKDYLSIEDEQPKTVESLWEEEIVRMEKANRYGNANNYRSALSGMQKVVSLDIPFIKVDYSWLIDLEINFRANGLKVNSVAVYMRTLRSVYNKAINYGIADANKYPFRRYRIKSEQSTPRVASINELQQFFNFKGALNNKLYHAWNIGRLIFLLRGINFMDLALLTRDNLKHGRVVYKRAKTHKIYSIKLMPLADKIIKSYMEDDREALLPILTNLELNNISEISNRIAQQRKTTNKWLKKIGEQLQISEKCTGYMFRYSHASACQKLGYSKELISYSLGHSFGLSVTSCYLEDYDLDVIDEMNTVVCNEVIRGV